MVTYNISEALKNHLREIKGSDSKYAIKRVDTFYEAVKYLLENPYNEEISIEGYEDTLNERIKIPESLYDRINECKKELDAVDREAALRRAANIEQRDHGERPVEITKI